MIKKLLGSALALVLMFPYQANAELLKNLKLTGQIDLQTQSSRNVTDFTTRPNTADFRDAASGRSFNDRLNDANMRVMLNMDWDWLDDVHSKVSLVKRNRTWGTTPATANGATSDQRGQSEAIVAAGNTTLGAIYVDQAYIKIDKMMGHVDATVGRQHYGTEGDIVIYYGPSNKALYGQPTTALDAVRADWNPGWMGLKVTGVAGKATGSPFGGQAAAAPPHAATTRDVDITGIKLDLKPMESVGVGAHLYSRLTHAIGPLGHTNDHNAGAVQPGLNNSLFVYGLKFRWEDMGFKVGAEWHKNSGEDRMLFARDANGDGDLGDAADYAGDANGDGVASVFDLSPDAKYSGQAFKIDAAYTAEAEGIATFIPWFELAQGTGRGAIKENKNDGFVAIRGDYRPGTIHGRFAPAGLVTLGSGIPCLPGAAFTIGAFTNNPLCTGGGTAIGTLANPTLTSNAAAGPTGIGSSALNNRLIWGLGMKITPAAANQLTLGVSWWNFRLQRDTDYKIGDYTGPTTAQLPAVGGRNGMGNGNKDIGSELDIDFNWKHSENVGLDFGLAGFRPGKYIQSIVEDARAADASTQAGLNPVYMAYADLRVKF